MRLKRLSLENFRCYREKFSIDFDDITAIIGQNDVGKSALMDALSIFFEDGELDGDDATMNGDRKSVQISCEFDELPSEIVIDNNFKTSLKKEFLLTADGLLHIRKTYNGAIGTPKILSVEAICEHPTAEHYQDILQLKKSELSERAKELGIDLKAVNKQANAPIREIIWGTCPDLKIATTAVSLESEGAKQVWNALSGYMPTFALFKSDRASTDQDPEAQDPLKAAIRDAIKSVEGELKKVQAHVETEVRKIADATVAKIKEMDPSLAETLNPIIKTKKWDSLFNTSITGETGIPLNKRGSGVKRVILLNFFRAKAERDATQKGATSVIYAVEEPETSQHPRNQRMLLSALTDISAAPSRQVIVTTHTPMLARAIPQKSLRFIEKNADGTRTLFVGSADTSKRIATSLGVLADNSVKAFIGVERKNDIAFLKGMARMLLASGEPAPDLDKLELNGEVIFFPLGGSNLALWSSRLSPLNRQEIHICDRDIQPPAQSPHQGYVDEVNNRPGCKAVMTNKREMENYLHPNAICEAYQTHNIAIGLAPAFADFDDVPEIVACAVHNAAGGAQWNLLDPEVQSKKCSKAKTTLNFGAVARMTPARLANTDPNGEIRGWLDDIQNAIDEAV